MLTIERVLALKDQRISIPNRDETITFGQIAEHPHIWKNVIDTLIADGHPLAAEFAELLAMQAPLPHSLFHTYGNSRDSKEALTTRLHG